MNKTISEINNLSLNRLGGIMEKELIQELRKLKEMYEEKIEEAQSVPHYEDQESYDWMAFAYEEIVLDLVHLIERVVREPLERNDDIVPNAFVGFLGKTEDGKVELAKKEIVKAFDINKTMKAGTKW